MSEPRLCDSSSYNTNNLLIVNQYHCARGFSLIELMIVVAMIGILTTIAIPAYNRYIERARATEAINTLASQGVIMEQDFQDNGRFTCNQASWTSTHFSFACAVQNNGNGFTLTASGTAAMSQYRYSLDGTGNRVTLSHPISTGNCWKVSGSEC